MHALMLLSAGSSFGESLSTLKFGDRAKQIRNKTVKNEGFIGDAAVLQAELLRVKAELEELKRTCCYRVV